MATASPGLIRLIIQTDTSASGSTSLAEIGGNYFLFAAGGTTGPELQYNGAAVTAGEFGGWNPIGAVQTANGYEVAWQNRVAASTRCGPPTATVTTPAI